MRKEQQTDREIPVVHGVDSWGYKVVTSPAFPLSLFMSDKGLLRLIRACNEGNSLLLLYKDNKQRIEKSAELKSVFAERQQAIKRQTNI